MQIVKGVNKSDNSTSVLFKDKNANEDFMFLACAS